MTARVLVVDDLLANVRLLEAKLTAEYFDVSTAMNGIDALETIQRVQPDIVLLDVMMPGMDGIEVCRRIKANSKTQHIPVIMVTALDQPEDRIRGLEAGADDFLTKPVNDLALFCRVKSLVRLKMLTDELRSRAPVNDFEDGVGASPADSRLSSPNGCNIMVVDDRGTLYDRISDGLAEKHNMHKVLEPQEAIFAATEDDFDLLIVDLDMESFDGLRLCSQFRSIERTRQIPILAIVDPDDSRKMLRALEMGVNDYLTRPIDRQELAARVETQLRRWRYTQKLRADVAQTMELAVTDPLTTLFNRRHMESQARTMIDNAANRGKAFSILTIDVDHFKAVNDTCGHDAGDAVLKELAVRMKQNIRNVDLPCRVGGEEFIIMLPDTHMDIARRVAERLRRAIFSKPFDVPNQDKGLDITVSIGVAEFEGPSDTQDQMFKRADLALYQAKEQGRNKVISQAA
jgi:two-component system cell cycle response regulator